eukprot:1062075-Prorocentrum_minimum.AAC.1
MDASLNAIFVSTVTPNERSVSLSPVFNKGVLEYTAIVENTECNVKVEFITTFAEAVGAATAPDAECTVRHRDCT